MYTAGYELNYEPVTTTTTEVVSVTGTNYSSYQGYDPFSSGDTYFEKHNNIGSGWSFNFDHIGVVEIYQGVTAPKYFHFGDGMSYEITSEVIFGTTHYYFTDRGLKDCILYDDAGSFNTGLNGSSSSSYKLVYKDGKTEYFNYTGQLIGIVDRYGNTIKLGYGFSNALTPSQVVTSNGQTIDFIWTGSSSPKTLEVKMGSQILQSYTLTSINGEINEWKLSSKTDRYGNTTNYSYYKAAASANFFLSSVNATPATIYYNLLTQVTYATGASTQYIYNVYNRELKDDNCEYTGGTYQYYRITKRSDNGEYNIKSYSYDLGSYTDGKAASGTITDSLGLRTVTSYNSDQLPTQQSIYNGQTLIKRISTSYTSTKLPSTVTTETFNGTESVSMSERFVYDANNKGDLTVYWSTRANNNFVTSNPATVLYTYDNTYHQLTSQTYYSDANTKIEELFTLSGDKKHAVTAITEVNDVVSAKTEYSYDIYGNVTKVRAYPDPTITTGYIDADLSYTTPMTVWVGLKR